MKIFLELSDLDELEFLKEWLNRFDAPQTKVTGEKLRFADETLNDLCFTVRTYNCIRAAGIDTLDELITHSKVDLLKSPLIGRKTIKEIESVLAQRGMALRSTPK